MAFTLGTEIARHYSKVFIPALERETVAVNCVTSKWASDLMKEGQEVNVRFEPEVAITDYSVDSTITYNTMSTTTLKLVIDAAKYVAIKLDKIDEKQSNMAWWTAVAKRSAYKMALAKDTYLITNMAANVPAYNRLGNTALGHAITFNEANIYPILCDAYALLQESLMVNGGTIKPWLMVPPRIMAQLKKSKQFTHASAAGDAIIRSGVIGEIAGFEIKQTTNITLNPAGTGTDAYYKLLFGVNEAYGFTTQMQTTENLSLQTTFANAFRGLCVYGGGKIRGEGLGMIVGKTR